MDGNEFLRRMRKGDHDDVLVELMPTIKSISLSACHRLRIYGQLRDDIVQDVAIKLFTNWESFRRESKLEAWIYSIARNRCLDEMRKIKVRGDDQDPTPYHEDDSEISATDLIVDHSQSNMEQRLCVEQMITELENEPPARKGSIRKIEVLRWIVENGPTSEELSQFLASSQGAAKERKSQTIKHLHELCQKFCGHDECNFYGSEVVTNDFTIR